MQWTSMLAIYVLFWVISAFVVLPFGIRSAHELGEELVPGQADGAPGNFRPLRVVIRTTLLAAFAFVLFYANYVYGWVGLDDINFFGRPPIANS